MNNVSGISNAASARASDMQLKIEYINELHGGDKGVVFATGTPISNSMAEMYIMQSYLQKNTLEELDINYFDGWAADFGETVTALEMAPSGQGYRARTRFAKFTNLPELMTLYRSFADVQTADMVKLDVPEAERITVTLEPSEQTVQIAEEIAKRAEAIYGGSVDPHEDNMLKVTSDGKKLALDVRCFDPFLKDEGTGKLDICADNAAKVYEETTAIRGTQLIFCDMSTPKKPYEEYEYGKDFDVYNDLKHKLIERGIPKEEIAFIHDAKTDKEKQALFDKMNEGRIRILIGSTEKCGAGTNVQKRLAALHHLDAPYRPRDLQQRDGRGIRQHNMNKSVKIFTYVKKRTLDSYCYQILENKQRFISQIENGSLTVREAEDIDETTLSYAEIKAITAANPKIKRKVELETELTRLRVLEGQYKKNLYALQDKTIKDLPAQIHTQEQRLKYAQEDEEHMRGKYNPDVFSINVLGKLYVDKKEGASALVEALRSNKYDTPVAEYGGFRISLNPPTVLTDTRSVSLTHHGSYDMEIGDSELGLITRLDNFMRDFPERKGRYSAKLEQFRRDLAVAEAELKKPFEHKGKIEEIMKELSEINAELDLNKREEVVIDTEEENDDEEVNYMALPEQEPEKTEPVKRPHKRMTEKQYKLYADYTAKYPDAVIFLKNGEFYETLGAEAKIAADTYGAATYEKELGGEKRIVAMLTYDNLDAMVNVLSEGNRQFKIVESEKEIDKETDFLETEEKSKAIAATEEQKNAAVEASSEEKQKVHYSIAKESGKYVIYYISDGYRIAAEDEMYAAAEEARKAAETIGNEPPKWDRVEVSAEELQEYASNMGDAAKVPVSVLPDYFVTQDEMHEYGYMWNGMLPLTKPAARHNFQDCLLLYEDDTEGYGETEQRIEEHDGLFGIERPGWKKFIESENGKAYLAARQFASTAVMKMVGEEYSDTDERELGEHNKFLSRLKEENMALSNYFKDKWFPLPEAMQPYAENIVAEYAERIFDTYKLEARGKSEEDIKSELENRIGIPYFADEKLPKEPGKNEYLDKMRETHDALPEYLAGLRVEYRSKDERFHLVTPPCAKALAEAGVHLYITENGRKKRLYNYPSWYTGETFLVDDEEWHNYLYTGRGAGYISARLVFVKAAKEITAETDGASSDRLYTALNAEEEDLTAVMSRQEHIPTSEEQNEYFAALADAFVRYFAADEQYYKENWNKNPYALKNAISEKIADPILKAAVQAELFKKSKEDLEDNESLTCYVIEHNEKTGKYHYCTIEDYEILVPSQAYDDEHSCRAAAPKGMELADMEQLAKVSRIQYEVYPDYLAKEDDGQYYALTKRKAQQLMNLGLPICLVNDEGEYVTIQNQAIFDKQDDGYYIGKAEWYGFVRTEEGKAYQYARLLAAKAAKEMVSEELDYVGYYADSFMEVFYAEKEDLERCFARKSVPSDEAVKPYLYGLCREYASRIDGNGNLREYGWWYEDVIKAIAEKLPDRFENGVERSANEEIKAIKPEKTYYAVIEKDGEWRLCDIDNYDTKVTYSKFQTEEKRTKYIEDMLSANSGLQFEEIPYEKLKEIAEEMKVKREEFILQNREVFLDKQMEEQSKPAENEDIRYAKANGEQERYRHSLQENIECKYAIEESIRNNFDGMHLNKGFENELIEKFGMERLKYVLANTVQENDWDGRYSPETKTWAKGVTITEKSEHRSQFIVGSHPAVLDGFIDRVRKAEKAYADSEKPKETVGIAEQSVKEKGEEMQEGEYRTKTKRGLPVVHIERDKYGHEIAIVKRKDDFVVAIGYDVKDGTWEQGRYDFPTQETAQAFIDEKYKPKTAEESDKKWLTAKVSKDALIQRYDRHSFFRMPNGEYADYSYNVFNNRVKDSRQRADLQSGGQELCYELVFLADGEITIKTRDGDEVIFPAEEFTEIVNGTTNADYEREEREDFTTWYAISVPQEAHRGTYEKSSLFAMPSKSEFAGYSYYIPNVFVEEDKREENGNILITLPETFHVTLRNRAREEEKVITVFELYTECAETKGEDYVRASAENNGENKAEKLQTSIPVKAKIAEYKDQTLFKMPEKSEYAGYCFYLFNDQLTNVDEVIQAKLSENFTVYLKDKKNERQTELPADKFKELMDEVKAEDFSEGLKKPSEEKENIFRERESLLRKNIPAEMLSRRNWVAVKVFRDRNKDKLVKLPKDAKTGEAASPLDPSTWSDFDTACKYARENGCTSLAYALDGKDKICCIDIDHCFNAKREMSEPAKRVWNACGNTYREVSVSGEGLHVFGKTDGLGLRVFSDVGDMEFYERGKFMTVTGDAYGESRKELLNLDVLAVKDLLLKKFSKHKTYGGIGKGIEGLSSMSDREVIEKASVSRHGDTFKALYEGKDLQNNHSNSDMSLMTRLAFWCNGDKEQMLRIFATSGLYRRDKSPEYYEHTALKAVRENPNRYEMKTRQSEQQSKRFSAKTSEGNSK